MEQRVFPAVTLQAGDTLKLTERRTFTADGELLSIDIVRFEVEAANEKM
jgi:hypothetical protein